MPLELTPSEIAWRLALTLIAGAVIGVNRGEHGRPAGLRTTVLVCLTASASMLLANRLLGTIYRPADSFVTMDVMRLPLGILTGMGFIGAGAILHKGNLVVGVTTAATLWFTTLMGFCFGAGEIGLGLALLGLGIFVLWGLQRVEAGWKQSQQATLTIRGGRDAIPGEALATLLASEGFKISLAGVRYVHGSEESRYQVAWRGHSHHTQSPAFLAEILNRPNIEDVEWEPVVKS